MAQHCSSLPSICPSSHTQSTSYEHPEYPPLPNLPPPLCFNFYLWPSILTPGSWVHPNRPKGRAYCHLKRNPKAYSLKDLQDLSQDNADPFFSITCETWPLCLDFQEYRSRRKEEEDKERNLLCHTEFCRAPAYLFHLKLMTDGPSHTWHCTPSCSPKVGVAKPHTL